MEATCDGDIYCLYMNHLCNSSTACRPLRISFEKESAESLDIEIGRMLKEYKELHPYDLNGVAVEYKGVMSLIDGKTMHRVTGNDSSQKCPVCHSLQKEFIKNNKDKIFDPIDPGCLFFGEQILHFGIRAFEHFLHNGYNMEFKQWNAKGSDEKAKKAAAKKRTHDELLLKIGVRVDEPRSSGGNSNSGNVARRCFDKAAAFSSVLGINEEIVHRIKVIWNVLRCGLTIDVD